jgi:RNA methyltransferase, TrmH family
MISKARIKTITSLKTAKYRKQLGLFVAEGSTNVLDFTSSELKAMEIYGTAKWIEKHGSRLLHLPVIEATGPELKKMSSLKTPPEVIGVFEIPFYPTPELNSIDDLALMLDDIRDPGNLGTIIRTADWFGIRHIMCSEHTVDAYNPKVVQASMGSLGRVRIYYGALHEILSAKPDYLKVFGAVLHGKNIDEIAKPHRGIIMIGNESRGISDELIKKVDEKITIPNLPLPGGSSAESLNASIAAAIICYEFRRQSLK